MSLFQFVVYLLPLVLHLVFVIAAAVFLFAAFVPIVFPIFHCLLCCFMHSSFVVSSSIFLHFLDATVESQLILCVLFTIEVVVHMYGKNKTDTRKLGFECLVNFDASQW